jgi:hypothetical protein
MAELSASDRTKPYRTDQGRILPAEQAPTELSHIEQTPTEYCLQNKTKQNAATKNITKNRQNKKNQGQ